MPKSGRAVFAKWKTPHQVKLPDGSPFPGSVDGRIVAR
jgi:hypothetical protein